MSLAITAAPFDNDNQNYSELNSDDTPVNRKRLTSSSTHNKTQKRLPLTEINHDKVNSVLQSIHNNSNDNELGDFNPKRNQASASNNNDPINPLTTINKLLAPPELMREKPDKKEGFDNNNNLVPVPLDNSEMELQELQSAFLNDAQVRDYYRKLVPNFHNKSREHNSNSVNKLHYKNNQMEQSTMHGFSSGNDVLLNKINYMINLLEEQQDERTNNVTEEVILYSFLGIFIIFLVDSFARVGKYTR
jgi:hypothetical protein